MSEMERRRSNSDAEFYRQQAQQLTTDFRDLAATLSAEQSKADETTKDVLALMEKDRINRSLQIREVLDGQARLIQDQGQARAEDRKIISELRERLERLEAEQRGNNTEGPPTDGGR